MATNIKLQLDPLSKIKAKRHLDESGNKKLASEVKRLCDPYVPMNAGPLKNTAQVLKDGVLYNQPYAAKQYYTNSGRGKQGTSKGGQRGKEWDKRMMADKKDQLLDAIAGFTGGKRS